LTPPRHQSLAHFCRKHGFYDVFSMYMNREEEKAWTTKNGFFCQALPYQPTPTSQLLISYGLKYSKFYSISLSGLS